MSAAALPLSTMAENPGIPSRQLRVVVDAGPILGVGGISGYVGPLIRALLLADSTSRYRLALRRGWATCEAVTSLQSLAAVTRVLVPDRLLSFWWKALQRPFPLYPSLWEDLDVFLATCLFVPVLRRGQAVTIVYDLTPLRLPSLFPDRDRFRQQVVLAIERSTAVVAISECTRRDLIELLGTDPTRIHVIYPGRSHLMRPIPPADAIRITERYGVSGPYILYVGSLGPHKNVPALLRAYERARACGGVSARLVVVGDDRWAAETLSALGRLQVGNDVVLPGFVPADDLPYFYAGAMCFAFPSQYEGFGLPVLEAMACGTPVIVSNSGALPEVVGGAGVVIDPADVSAFAGAIYRLVNDADLHAILSARALERAGHFSWEQSAKALLAVLSGTAAQGH